MNNPFAGLMVKPEGEVRDSIDEHQEILAKRDNLYSRYDAMVNEVLGMFIAAHRPGIWEKDSDFSRRYCCHVAWFAGPKEVFSDPYDVHHTLRRRLEITLEMDGVCNPFGFKVTTYENIVKTIHVGLERDELVRGISEVMR